MDNGSSGRLVNHEEGRGKGTLRTPLREHFHGLARNVADRLDVRTDHAEDVAAQMHAVGDAVTAESLAGAVRRLRFED